MPIWLPFLRKRVDELPTASQDNRGFIVTLKADSGSDDELYWSHKKADDSYELIQLATAAPGAHTHSLGDITDDGTMAAQNANSVAITGGSIAGITDLAVADGGTGASTAGAALSNLGGQPLDADLTTLATAFTSASASGPASLALHEDTDNGTNKAVLTAPASMAADRTITLPNATTTLVGTDTSDTLTNKAISGASISGSNISGSTNTILMDDNDFQLRDNGDVTKTFQFQASGITTLTNRTLTVPDADGTIALTGHTHTLANISDITASATEVNYTDGVTSAIQTQIDGKAPVGATYITQTANGTLTAEQALGALATGILKNTTTTGVLSIAVGADLPTHTHAQADVTSLVSDLALKAPLASPTFTGTVTVADLTTTGNTVLGNAAADAMTVAGQIETTGTNPTVTPAAALGSTASGTCTGNDTSGMLELLPSGAGITTGVQATINFSRNRASTNFAVSLTPASSAARALATVLGVSTKAVGSVQVSIATALTTGSTYQWDYIIVGHDT